MERFLRWSTALLNLKTDCDTGFDFSANFVHLIYLCQEFQKACSKEEPDWVDKFEAAVVAISNTAYPIKTALDCGSLGLLMGSNSEMTVAIQLMCLRGEVPTGKYLEKRIKAIMTKGLLMPKPKTKDAEETAEKSESKIEICIFRLIFCFLIKIKKYIIRFLIYFDFYTSYRTVRSHLPIK